MDYIYDALIVFFFSLKDLLHNNCKCMAESNLCSKNFSFCVAQKTESHAGLE